MKILLLFLISQYFGQNKIQYQDFKFSVLKTDHFAIYYYEGEEKLAAFAQTVLEENYLRLKEDLSTDISFEIPVIIYNSPNEFSQTNVTLELIEESVGGFTEIFKNRVVVPFSGSYEDFRHVLVHELTHVFEFAIFFGARMSSILSAEILSSIPLWVMEGLAEYESLEWDQPSDIFMRDLVVTQKVIPLDRLEMYGGFVIYKEGQSFYHFVAQRYGRKKIGSFIHAMKAKKNLDDASRTVFGVGISDLTKIWLEFYQLEYWPRIRQKLNLNNYAQRLIYAPKFKSVYNTSVAISPRGDRLALISDRIGTTSIFIVSTIDGTVLKRLVDGEYSAGFESMHLYKGGISWSPDERLIAFAAKSRGRDVLYLTDTKSGKTRRKLTLGPMQGIYSPKFSPDGQTIACVGLVNGHSDIYTVNVSDGSLSQLTNDVYDDHDPAWSPDGSKIVFVSDRPDSGEYKYGAYALFTYEAGSFTRVTPRTDYLAFPFYHPTEPYLLFVADFDNAQNLYLMSTSDNRTLKRTDILTAITYPSISSDGLKVAFAYQNEMGFDVYIAKNIVDKLEAIDSVAVREKAHPGFGEDEPDYAKVSNYKPRFSFDYLTGSVGYESFFGFSGTGNIALSDVLGNHRIYIYTDLWGNIITSNLMVNYWYIPERVDYGSALFQFTNYYRSGWDLLVKRYLGGSVTAQYPLSKFLRAELGFTGFALEETRIVGFFPNFADTLYYETSNFVAYPDVAFVFDNAQWAGFGPHNGTRARIEGYKSTFSNIDFLSVNADYRRYIGLGMRFSFAFRTILAGSFGKDPEIWSFGGPDQLRAYDFYDLYGSKIGLANLELRHPFIDRLKFAFPLPVEIRNIRGCLFADFGGVYTDSFKLYEREQNWIRLKDLKMDVGFGLRASLFFFILKLDFARKFDLYELDPDWKIWFTIGPEF